MNKKIYSMIGFIPIIGKIIQTRANYFEFKCSPFMEDFIKTKEHDIIKDWMKKHPKQTISEKKAKELIKKAKES